MDDTFYELGDEHRIFIIDLLDKDDSGEQKILVHEYNLCKYIIETGGYYEKHIETLNEMRKKYAKIKSSKTYL